MVYHQSQDLLYISDAFFDSVLSQVNPAARLSQTVVEVLNQPSPAARIAQAAVEVLSSTLEAPVLETQPVIFICT